MSDPAPAACPHRLNAAIEGIPIPAKMAGLPIGPNGFPVPWFTPWIDGVPEFRAAASGKIAQAVRESRCWVCGEHRGRWLTFVIGPMCAINRVSSEPPAHLECARYSALACPFLARPRMVRRDASDLETKEAPGFMSDRNPRVTLLYTTRIMRPFRAPTGGGGILFRLGEPTSLEWYREGRPASRAEVEESVRTGLPFLEELARQEEDQAAALADLHALQAAAETLYPRE
jgi:hypothetical protein